MIIISIDPGYERLGIAVLEKKTGKEELLYSNCLRTPKENSHEERTLELGLELEELIKKYSPTIFVFESIFFNSNQKTAMSVAKTLGALIYVAKKSGLETFEFTPPQIKLAVTGNGRSSKEGVIKMIPLLIKISKKKMLDDEYDAIACGLTLFANYKMLSTKNNS
jgi:crossover junction endodeoxyribonuclease RuvC